MALKCPGLDVQLQNGKSKRCSLRPRKYSSFETSISFEILLSYGREAPVVGKHVADRATKLLSNLRFRQPERKVSFRRKGAWPEEFMSLFLPWDERVCCHISDMRTVNPKGNVPLTRVISAFARFWAVQLSTLQVVVYLFVVAEVDRSSFGIWPSISFVWAKPRSCAVAFFSESLDEQRCGANLMRQSVCR